MPRAAAYQPPTQVGTSTLAELLVHAHRFSDSDLQQTFDFLAKRQRNSDRVLYYAGDLDLVRKPCVAIVGTREVSPEGAARARRLARELSVAGVTIVSGLAYGVDTEAHSSTLESGGRAIAVIGTPLDKATPAQNRRMQEEIYRHHLLISPFAGGTYVGPANFPQRNQVMAAIADATVIIEASDTSGTLHQAAECQRLGRWLFIARAVAEDPSLKWPKSFLGKYPRAVVLTETGDVISRINAG